MTRYTLDVNGLGRKSTTISGVPAFLGCLGIILLVVVYVAIVGLVLSTLWNVLLVDVTHVTTTKIDLWVGILLAAGIGVIRSIFRR